MELSHSSRPVAPGARLTSFRRLEPGRWLRGDALSVRLGGGRGGSAGGESDTKANGTEKGGSSGGARAEYLSSGDVSSRMSVRDMVERHGTAPGRRTVAAINADFFDIDKTNAPLGPSLDAGGRAEHPDSSTSGRMPHSPASGNHKAVGFGPDAAGRILDLYFAGTVSLPDGRRRLAGYNSAALPKNGIGAYNSRWGTADRALAAQRDKGAKAVTVRAGRVVGASRKSKGPKESKGSEGRSAGSAHTAARPLVSGNATDAKGGKGDKKAESADSAKGAIKHDSTVLIGRGRGARALTRLRPGDPVSMAYHLRTKDGSRVPRTAVGGRGVLVVDGKPQDWRGKPNNAPAPRTAVGFSKDGSTMHILTVDGRAAASDGVTLTELARMMRKLGAYNALNLDGGGSSTLLASAPGGHSPRLENAPSDGKERKVADGLALTVPKGSGRLHGFRVETAVDPAEAPTADTVPGGHPHRVFPGLSRRLTATGYDETYGPAPGAPHWRAARSHIGRVDSDGVFHARHPGRTSITASRRAADGTATGTARLSVLGSLDRLHPTHDRVALANAREKGTFGLVGFDEQGTSAPVDPADVRLHYDRSAFDVHRDASAGGFTVRARKGRRSASGIITATVATPGGRHTARIAATVGLHPRRVADFDRHDRRHGHDGSNGQDRPDRQLPARTWKFSAARAKGSLTPARSGHHGAGLRMTYDFTKSDGIRAAYAMPRHDVHVSGRPRSFRMWVRSDGKGAWPSLHIKDANGADRILRAPHLDKKGWQRLTFRVPKGVSYPLRLHRFYLAETRPAEQYKGRVVLGSLDALVPPRPPLPPVRHRRDPLVATGREVAGRDWRFAVLSGTRLKASDPHGPGARQARRALRHIRAARPDFLIVDGDLVDKGTERNLRYAHRMLREELGDAVDWIYVPGDHERQHGSVRGFRREFGANRRVFDHWGTRFITLDTSSGSLRGGGRRAGYRQVRSLRRQLDRAAADPSIRSVAVVTHVSPRKRTGDAEHPAGGRRERLTDRVGADLLEHWLSGFRARTGKGVAFVGAHDGRFDVSRVDGVPYLTNGSARDRPRALTGSGRPGWTLLGVTQHRLGLQTAPGGGDWIAARPRPVGDGGDGSAEHQQQNGR